MSAYTTGLMEQISDKFNKIVGQVNENTKNLKTKLREEDLKLQKELTMGNGSAAQTPQKQSAARLQSALVSGNKKTRTNRANKT